MKRLKEGDTFGEKALYENSVRIMTAMAESELVICLALGRETIIRIFGDKLQIILF
jgi:cGMP-dependent protein kinase